jgi:hypothetical protein
MNSFAAEHHQARRADGVRDDVGVWPEDDELVLRKAIHLALCPGKARAHDAQVKLGQSMP